MCRCILEVALPAYAKCGNPQACCTQFLGLILQVRVSEFNSTPVTCTITGSAAPGTVKDRLLKHTLGRSGSGRKSQGLTLTTMEDLDGSKALQNASLGWSTNLGGGNAKGGELVRVARLTSIKQLVEWKARFHFRHLPFATL